MLSRPRTAVPPDEQPGGSRQSEHPVEVRSGADAESNDVDYLVLSLGTGEVDSPIRYEDAKNWGTLRWARPLIDIAYDGSSDTVDGQMRQLMHARQKALPLLPLSAEPQRRASARWTTPAIGTSRTSSGGPNRSSTTRRNWKRSKTSAVFSANGSRVRPYRDLNPLDELFASARSICGSGPRALIDSDEKVIEAGRAAKCDRPHSSPRKLRRACWACPFASANLTSASHRNKLRR